MFLKIFLFEIQNRVRRPAVYLYFLAALLFTVFTFSTGSLPLGEKEHINAPYVLALWCSGITMMITLVSSSIMGTALYRDIEYNTKDYYLTYPITKAGYFWGRYLGSFVFMIAISSAIIIGAFIGTKLGPTMGWTDVKQYGPNNLIYYLHPFFTIGLPNVLFTSSLFFGLVALTRNVKVIYFGGILLFLFYFIALFFLNHVNNPTIINLSDPFGLNGIRMQTNSSSTIEQNTTLFPVTGTFMLNRIVWGGIGIVIVIFTYLRFSFERFFSGRRDKAAIDEVGAKTKNQVTIRPTVSFSGKYNQNTLRNLVKVELLNIIRDNYFWIILLSGSLFLGFVFWLGEGRNGVPDFPRTVTLLAIFNDAFPFFIFFIIMFYTGETLHRDRATRYAFINDSLPPPNWILNGSKLITLLLIGTGLSFIPIVTGVIVQLLKGYHALNIAAYLTYIGYILLPSLLEMVVFCYVVHVVVNNKFAAHGIGVFFWVIVFFLRKSGIFDYNLLLYSYTPSSGISDMTGIGYMATPINWFNLYWLLFAGLLIIVSALFYYRGVTSSFKERLRLLQQRFNRITALITAIVAIAFLAVGGWNYYNVNFLNAYLIKYENTARAVLYEKTLKKYEHLPLPKVTNIKMQVELYPDKQQVATHAWVTVINKNKVAISQILLDGDDLTAYSLKTDGVLVPFSTPLLYPRGVFNWFRPKVDTADFRLYRFTKPLLPGDSLVLEINSEIVHKGFTNGMYAAALTNNGTFFNGGLPGLGYDEDDELGSPYERKKAGLPEKKEEEIQQDNPEGINTLKAGRAADLLKLDVTIGTLADQTAIAPGQLVKNWQQDGRNYFHYVQDKPGMYMPMGIISEKLAVKKATVQLDHQVNIEVYYHPEHNINIDRYIAAYKDGLTYYSKVYGNYPFNDIRLVETSVYGPQDASMTTLNTYAEYFGWNADFRDPNSFDYCYGNTTRLLSQQWWRFQTAPNSTVGSLVIPEGLSNYDQLVMSEHKYGKDNMRYIVLDQLWYYLFIRRHLNENEHPLIKANNWFLWGGKASVALYGLRDLIGEDSLNVALREFKKSYAFKTNAPFPGANNLYQCLQKHVPDSLQYYLTDTWQKITMYDNRVIEASSKPTGSKNEYKVTFKLDIDKAWKDAKNNDIPAVNMNDYIDIGIFGRQVKGAGNRMVSNTLYLKKYKLKRGQQQFSIVVKGEPVSVGIDPFSKLIDRNPNDNIKDL
jgi:ABC-type transport system involved in multi-copper enzyme maturation permease subunit